MHDQPPPYPGINPNYTPSYPANSGPQQGFGGQQPPQMGFAGSHPPHMGLAGGVAPQMGFAGGAAPPYSAGGYPSNQPASNPGYPQAAGSSYPTLPQNGFAGGFQPGPSAPSSSEYYEVFRARNFNFLISFSDERARGRRICLLRSSRSELRLCSTASVLREPPILQ